ncbi:sortase domain-containing protein [Nocardioides conyzicola]|uniref:Class E sortase n=1 Tax=Nocardioides conyzicola TaxID=1651781 RepID=A0ABP8XRF6_9ACTN
MHLTPHRIAIGVVAAVASVLVGTPSVAQAAPHETREPHYSSGKPYNARLTIPKLPRIHRLLVVAYRGKTDDGPGTKIQNRGIAASSHGPEGGTGPGGLGNYQVAAHRTSHGGIFHNTPSLRKGDRVLVDMGKWRYVYRIVGTRWVSFRSAKSLRAQRAAVPGKPGKKPHHAYITISTCATPEDHARGNYWTDRYGNPEHRIDKIGRLVKRVPRPA